MGAESDHRLILSVQLLAIIYPIHIPPFHGILPASQIFTFLRSRSFISFDRFFLPLDLHFLPMRIVSTLARVSSYVLSTIAFRQRILITTQLLVFFACNDSRLAVWSEGASSSGNLEGVDTGF